MMATPYLCVMYLATAGQQGNLLGADEEEIVLLVYVVIDMAKNQVVGIHQFLVKPRVADINENVLSEQLVAESRLTEDMVKNGQSLEAAIMQFEHYVKATFHIGPSPHSLRLITDGQLPLRQCLHPEASSKNLELPAYYAVFHDLRKEFKQFYNATEDITSVQDMVTYLGMTPNTTNDFFVKEIKDMVDITQRLIADGHKFETPETVSLRLEPGICSKNEEVDNNCVVRARGLPWQSSDQDIAKFFRGLNVAKGGVALCLSPQGRRNGEALVRFVNQEHRDMALKRHKHHIGNRYIEVYKASGDDFISVAGGNNNEAQAFLSRGAQVIVRMRGLPYDCTAKQVLEFFDIGENACKVMDDEEGVLFVKKPDGRATGDAFVLFAQEEDSSKALSKHRELIGSRYIELFRSTTAEVQQVLNRSMDPKTYEQQQPLIAQIPQVPLLPQHIITSGTRKDCIRLRGLPYEAQVEHILDFLGEHAKSIVFQGVHMVYNAQGQPSGEAFIQMESEQSAYIAASQKHHRYMIFGKKQRYIEVFQCSGEDMNLVLTGGLPAPGAVSPAAKAATLLSPGMLSNHPPPIGPPPQLYESSFPLVQHVQAQQALAQQVQHNLAIRQSQHESLMFLNQIAVAQQHQAAMAAALNAAANSKQNWPDMNSLGDSPVVSSPPSTSTSSLAISSNTSTIAKQNGTQYGSLVHSGGYPSHPPPSTAGLSAGVPPGMFLLNMGQRLPVGNPLLAQPPPGAAFHPRVPPPPIPTHPPPSHGMLPHLMPAASGLMGAKRSWEQAFPAELQQAGLKRTWQTPPTLYQQQSALSHPAFTYQNTQLQFYPAM